MKYVQSFIYFISITLSIELARKNVRDVAIIIVMSIAAITMPVSYTALLVSISIIPVIILIDYIIFKSK